ncbi:MAG: RNA pseudouridine synthase, partial [Muribaculaceae bacterium]|nr:RNA pseudouridine synthase [Muribaculaceae bacterium]
VAVLAGEVEHDAGTINLPLRPDVDDRPRQMVDPIDGREAVTRYRVLQRSAGRTRVDLQPLTGRTHQLRIHAAHPQGLNAPIEGDMLYGTAAQRLMLHAQRLTFTHPVTGRVIDLVAKAPF